jgi:hypothetical protein
MAQRPNAIGLYLCEQVIYEEGTRNVTLVNCFTRRWVSQLPSDPISFIVFATLTDGLGTMTVEVSIQRPDNLEEIYQASLQLELDSPLREARCRFPFVNCVFPIEGAYPVFLLIDGEAVAQKRLIIREWTE